MKGILSSLFFGIIFSSSLFSRAQHQEIFDAIYANRVWSGNDGVPGSGPGSTEQTTRIYRHFLQHFLTAHHIQSVVDLGCGDWEFSKLINWKGINYLGLDIVQQVIDHNREQFGSDSIQFMHANGLESELPSADLLICKDVLQHLPNSDILKILKQCSKFKYCLITNGIDPVTFSSDNADISIGDYRPVDLTKPPFNISATKILSYRAGNFVMQVLLICN